MIYTLEDLAKKWNKSENDILRMAINNEIVLSAWWEGAINIHEYDDDKRSFFYSSRPFIGFFPISGYYVMKILANRQPVLIHEFHCEGRPWYFATNSHDSGKEGPYTTVNLTRSDICITTEEVEASSAKRKQLTTIVTSKNKPAIGNGLVSRPAAPPETADKDRLTSTTPFTQAIEKMYQHYYDRGEYDVIRPKHVASLILRMQELINKDLTNEKYITQSDDVMELIDYLAVRIESVRKLSGKWEILSKDSTNNSNKRRKSYVPSCTYPMKDVTKKL